MQAIEIGMPRIETTAAQKIAEIKQNEGSVYTDPLRDIINFQAISALDGQTEKQKEEIAKMKSTLEEEKGLFTEQEYKEFQEIVRTKGILAKMEINYTIEKRKETEKKFKDYSQKYEAHTEKNKKWTAMPLDQKLEFLEKTKKLIEILEKHAKEKGLITDKRLKATLKSTLENFDEKDISKYLISLKKLFEKENFDIHIFDQASQIKGLPYPVRKMSEASKKFYLEYYTEEDFPVREKIIGDWETIVEHEERLLQKFMDIFSDYPDELTKKLTDFQDLDFVKKEEFLKIAEIKYPRKKKKTSEKPEEKGKEVKTEELQKKPEKKEFEEKEKLEKECINKALDALKMDNPEEALTILMAYKKANGMTPKIKFHIKSVLSYIQEIELADEKEKELKEKTDKENAQNEVNRISRIIEDIFSGMALKRLIKQERLIAKNIRGAMKNEQLHKGEKDATKRAKAQSLESTKTMTDKKITDIFYKNEDSFIINESGEAEKVEQIHLSNERKNLDADEFFRLSQSETSLNQALSEKGKGSTNVNFYNSEGDLISAKTAMEAEKSRLNKVANSFSEKITRDIQMKGISTQIDLTAIIKARLSKEVGVS
jgi:hypothetical protein